ncbi:MAG TPA: phosphatidylglycerol lysyltransferase domain-containing protein, partial [Actinomycetota bacterium]
GKVVHSFLRTDPLKVSEGSRIFVARRGSHVEAFLACSPVPARDGWYLEDLVRLPNAPNGATELLVVEALHRLQQEGASYATLGIAPFRGAEQQIDRRARVVMPAVRWGLAHFDRRYRFASMSHYKAKFNATGWEPRFVAFSPAVPTLATVRAAISALDPPDPAPEHAPGRTPGERAVVGQASALVLASLLVLARSHLREDLWSTAGLLAPAGVAGLLTGVLLLVASFRMAHVAGRAAVTAAFGVELILVLGAGVRIHDGRFAPFELFVAAFAGASAILLLRSPPAAAGRPTPED